MRTGEREFSMKICVFTIALSYVHLNFHNFETKMPFNASDEVKS